MEKVTPKTKRVTIDDLNWCDHVQVWQVTEYRNGCVYKTKPIGYAHKDRPKHATEVYSPISLSVKLPVQVELLP